MKSFTIPNLDTMGICTSLLCGFHCAITPLIALVFPTFVTALIDNQAFHISILVLSVLLACISLIRTYFKVHQTLHPLIWCTAGICILLSSHFAQIESLEISLSVFGGGLIAIAHIKNINICNRCLKIKRNNQHAHL